MAKRLATIRRGIRYQDLVAAEALLEMISGSELPPLWVRLEDKAGGSFDDVVVGYPDRVVWKQVKWAQNPGSEPLTIDSLCKKRGRRAALITNFGRSFQQITADGSSCGLELITNRSPDSELREYLSGRTSKIKTRLKKAQLERLAETWKKATGLNDSEFAQFLRSLSFFVNSPDIQRREQDIRERLRLMGCPIGSFELFIDAIWEWAQDDDMDSIDRPDVERALKINLETPPNEFLLPPHRVERVEIQEDLQRRIADLSSGYLVLLGSPGSGKSTILNTLNDVPKFDSDYDVIVYNCFTGTSDSFLRKRARAGNFVKFLARELYDLYPHSGRLVFAQPDSIEDLFARAGRSVSEGKKLILVVDGLDYAKRFAPGNAEGVFSNLPPVAPENVIILVSAQSKDQLPHPLQRLDDAHYLQVPPFDATAINSLLAIHGIFESNAMPHQEREDLCRDVLAATAGHALHVSFVARQLEAAANQGRDLFALVESIPASDGDIERYYQLILGEPSQALTRHALKLMANCPFGLSAHEIASLLSPSADPRSIEDALREFGHLFERIGDCYYFSHDSLRVFADRQFDGPPLVAADQQAFLLGLSDDPRVGDQLLVLLAVTRAIDRAAELVNCDWLALQIAAGANTKLLHEGLRDLAIAAIEMADWGKTTRFWALKSCLERAEFEGDLSEQTLVNAWLAMNRVDLVQRYAFVSSHFLSRTYPGLDIIELAEEHGHQTLAERLRDRLLTQSAPDVDLEWGIDDFESYIRHLGRRSSATEVLNFITRKVDESDDRTESQEFPSMRPSLPAVEYARSVAYECLHAGELNRVDEWLQLEPSPFSDDDRCEIYLRLRLARRDLAEHRDGVIAAIAESDDEWVLSEIAAAGGFDDELRCAFRELSLSPIFEPQFSWYEHRRAVRLATALFYDVSASSRLSIDERVQEIQTAAKTVECKVARGFLQATIQIAISHGSDPINWPDALHTFIDSLPSLDRRRIDHDDIDAAQAFVCGFGNILGPIAALAKEAGAESQFGQITESELLPTLRKNYIHYQGGLLSLADMLQDLHICQDTVHGLLTTVEETNVESVEFKSGSLIDLAARFAKADDMDAAQRNLVAGVRAAFTYGYRKDTTLNEFIVAFEALTPNLETRFEELSEFIARVIILLDDLSDGRMLYYTASYFIALVCERDFVLGARLAKQLSTRCRSLRPHSIRMAAEDRGVDIGHLKATFEIVAPDVDLTIDEDDESDSDPRHDFVVSSREFSDTESTLVSEVSEGILSSSFRSGLHSLPSLIKSLLAIGDAQAALGVFAEFERALRELLAPYPLREAEQV